MERFERFSFALSEISRHWHKLTADEMNKYGLKGTHSIYLLTLSRYPEGLTAENAQKMKTITYQTVGTCSRFIELTGDNGIIVNVKFYGGCNGNLQGISSLVKGMRYEDVIARLKGISCNGKPTSCPDQLCCAIEQLMQE